MAAPAKSKHPNETIRMLRRFRFFMRGSGAKYLGGVLAVLITVIVGFITPLLLGGTIDAITSTLSGNAGAPVNMPEPIRAFFEARGGSAYLAQHIWIIALVMLGLNLFGGAFQYLRGKWTAEASETITERMRRRLYEHLQSLGYDFHIKAETGDLIQRCTLDVDTVRKFLASQVIDLFRILSMICIALAVMLSIHVKLTLLSLILMPPLFCLALWFTFWVQKLFKLADEAEGKMSAVLQESMTGVRVVRAFGRQKYEEDRFGAVCDDVHDKWVKTCNILAVYWPGSDLIGLMQTVITLLGGIWFAHQGELTAGQVSIFTSYVAMLVWPIRQLGRLLSDFSKALVSLRRLFEILDFPPEQDYPNSVDAPLDGDIEFRNVAFRYGSQTPVLKDISFVARAGQTVAILGATGSGKSTMMNLLQRLYEVTGGEILIGGRDIRTIRKAHLRSRVGYVLQEPFLYSRTIRNNIAIAREDAAESEIERVAHITASDKFISEFELGYDTMVGERGVTLSGGQKQRLSIARTLLRENDILILDDSLSAVDTETDKRIREALAKQRNDREKSPTTFIISHRVTTLADADLILVLENGRISEQGTHAELIERDGLYRRIYRIQAALEEELTRETA